MSGIYKKLIIKNLKKKVEIPLRLNKISLVYIPHTAFLEN